MHVYYITEEQDFFCRLFWPHPSSSTSWRGHASVQINTREERLRESVGMMVVCSEREWRGELKNTTAISVGL